MRLELGSGLYVGGGEKGCGDMIKNSNQRIPHCAISPYLEQLLVRKETESQ